MRRMRNPLLKKEVGFKSVACAKPNVYFSKSDKIIMSAHAIFEGIGIAGLISAAFWYTTAPIAPDGFKGPISTITITLTTIISLLLAIPIATLAFKKLMLDMDGLYLGLKSELARYLSLQVDVTYELLKLRGFFLNDSAFKKHVTPLLNKYSINESISTTVSLKYNQFKTCDFTIEWQQPIRLTLGPKKINSVSFLDIISDKHVVANKAIRKSLAHFMDNQFIDDAISEESIVPILQAKAPKPQFHKNLIYGIASGIACAEVLLSIAWTVTSILIGLKTILPISNMLWGIFAVSCIVSGTVFGLCMGVSRHKHQKVQLLHASIKEQNIELSAAVEELNNAFTEIHFLESTIKSDSVAKDVSIIY